MNSNKELIFKEILDRNLKEKNIDNLINDLLREIEDTEVSKRDNNYLDLLFLLYLDEISQKLYRKSEEEEVLPLVEKEKYSNNKGTGYFDSLFKAASILIFKLLNKSNWNVILKMDVHNCPLGPSLFSLVSCVDSKPFFSFKKNDKSKAYSLFFLYNLFCKDSLKNGKIKREDVYTVHKEFSEKKAIRSITYQYNENRKLHRYFDGADNGSLVYSQRKGELLYMDFLSCVLDENFITKDTLFSNYVKERRNRCSSSSNNPWSTAKSFSFFNLGVSGFESWGTLMIEAFESNDNSASNAKEVNDCFYHKSLGDEDREDGRELGKIKSIISALKKVDDEYNDALNKLNIKKESIKSAIAAIMSRNMSHNLGSHYLYYTKNQLASLADNFDEAGPDIRGAAKVLGYMQARMDYLATIVSGDKYPYGAVFFKGQIFDELTIDDFSKRHFHDEIDRDTGKNKKFKRTTNYLLQNLILSENFTREPVLDSQVSKLQDGTKCIRLQIMYNGCTFTGADGKEEKKEEKAKLSISKLCIALPGGVMSIHAFYNVIENLIRNSAKYHKNDFKDELVFTICINEVEADVKSKLPIRYEFILFDNKANALNPYSSEDKSPLFQRMNRELCNLKILTEKNELDKSNKGLKEMLFSMLWMRAYTYEKSKHMPDIIAEMDQLSGEEKMVEIRQHAFEYVAVDKNGIIKNSGDSLNLGIRFELPKYCMMENVYAEELNGNLIEKGLNNFTDILCVDNQYSEIDTLRTQFTRVHEGIQAKINDDKTAVTILKEILELRFPGFNKYKLKMDSKSEKGFSECNEQEHGIFFKTHAADLEVMSKFAYCEAISGENFTKTMLNLFKEGFNIWGLYKDYSSEYFALKIKEAALTRITLIDERLYNDMLALKNKKDFLTLKNIRVLNLSNLAQDYTKEVSENLCVKSIFDGNDFRDQKDATHFLSIHLGMIEKIVKDDSKWVKAFGMESKPTNDRVNLFMKLLKNTFKPEIGEVYISIHSGRGNFSPELDDSLKLYPFISISAIESTYANSKFLLAQMFYNTVYIGKGVTNAGE